MDLKRWIRDVPDFPKPGIMFRDITPLLQDPEGLRLTLDRLGEVADEWKPDLVLGIEARGFILGPAIAYRIGRGFVPVRKPGKLPADKLTESYALEYGSDHLEIHRDALPRGARVMVVDDLLATGGTAGAASRLVEKLGASVVGLVFVIELAGLNGRDALSSYRVQSLVTY